MIYDIFMPALSSTMTEGKIISWEKSPGDKVTKGETVVIIESDKADMDVESFYDGYLATILVKAGEEAPVGEAIALIAETKEEITNAQDKAPSIFKKSNFSSKIEEKIIEKNSTESYQGESNSFVDTNNLEKFKGRIIASPRAKKIARDLGIDLNKIKGSGPYGRIVTEDLQDKQENKTIVDSKINTSQEVIPFSTMQKTVAKNMLATLGIPVFRVSYDINTEQLDKLYQSIKTKGVTMTVILAKAIALTLRKHSLINAKYESSGIQYCESINIAIAVAIPDGGLITPVLNNVDKTDIYSLSRIWKDLLSRARTRELKPSEYSNGTFTLSNLGMFGVDTFDAILPPEQGSILAIGASKPHVIAISDKLFGIQNKMTVNITCDHRIIYGSHAASFLQDLAKVIESNTQLLTM